MVNDLSAFKRLKEGGQRKLAKQTLLLKIGIILAMVVICLALGIHSIKNVHAANPRFVPIANPSQSSTLIADLQAVAASANMGSATHESTLGWWDALFVLLIIEAEVGIAVTHKIREKKTLMTINRAILPSLHSSKKSVFETFRKTSKRKKLHTPAIIAITLAFAGGSLIFYAAGIASNFFALPIFKAFFFFSSETAHNIIAYLAALIGSLTILSCIIMAYLHQDLSTVATRKNADPCQRNDKINFADSSILKSQKRKTAQNPSLVLTNFFSQICVSRPKM